MTRRFTVAEPLSAIDEARRTGKALIVGEGEVFVLTRHVAVRRDPPAFDLSDEAAETENGL